MTRWWTSRTSCGGLGENRKSQRPEPVITRDRRASQEVRSGIVYATVIILLVFVPLFAMPGHSGPHVRAAGDRLYRVDLRQPCRVDHGHAGARILSVPAYEGAAARAWRPGCPLAETPQRARIELGARPRPHRARPSRPSRCWSPAASVPLLPRSFLPEFNEGNIYVTLLLNPDTSLPESYRIGHLAEQILMQVPEVKCDVAAHRALRVRFRHRPGQDNEMPLKIKLDHGTDACTR